MEHATARDKSVALNYLWQRLREEYALHGWALVIDERPKRRLGQCRYRTREIGMTGWYVRLAPWHLIEDTLRHEIAHALVGPGHGHGPVWKRKAVEVGARPRSCKVLPPEVEALRPKTAKERGQHRWEGACTSGCVMYRKWKRARLTHRVRHGASCPRCRGRITWIDRYGC